MNASSSSTTLAKHTGRYRPLESSSRLRLYDGICLSVRFAGYECGLCATACPCKVIELTAEGPAITGECVGCGQCVGACPTGALQTDGFSLPVELGNCGDEIFVDCWRVPYQDSPTNAIRVPCLGGITKGWLLALFDRAGEKPIHLIDRGECHFCRAGAGIKDLLATLTEARTLLYGCGIDIDTLPVMTSIPAKGEFSPSIPSTANEVRIDRRGFFRGLMGSVARSAEEINQSGATANDPIIMRGQASPIEQMRIATALSQIAHRHDKAVPSHVLPQLLLGDCSAHGVCAKVCPTGALLRQDSDDHAELQFNAAQCIACGQCARICPDRAIKVTTGGGTIGIEVLARWQANTCKQCGGPYFGSGGTTCGPCTKNLQLNQGIAALFGRSNTP